MRQGFVLPCCLILASLASSVSSALAQQQFQGWCARVKMEILQELTTERIGFEATLEITNNQGEDPITDFSAELTFEDPTLSTEEKKNDASDLFFVQKPRLESINAIDGSGVIGPTKKAVVRWFIIPKPEAGGKKPQGKQYSVGCRLAGKLNGVEIPERNLLVVPDEITVKPEPQLEITYFQPRDVQGDDPFTPEVESPIPFTLGVLVHNAGYGLARDVKIDSEQPKIVENEKGLLLVARLLGARVMDKPREDASLQLDLGDIQPGGTKKGAWDMITSLSGEFIEFDASYTHAAELGGEETSIIKSLEAHFIAHEVLNDQPGRDDILDFLADTDRDSQRIPDALYESEGNILPVNHFQQATISESLQGRSFTVSLEADKEGWGYIRLDDPGQAKFDFESVVRSDGKELNLNNVWTNIRYRKSDNQKLTFLNIFDKVKPGEYEYVVTYKQSEEDNTPPETTLRFAGESTEADGTFYIRRNTELYFTSEDKSPVSISYKLVPDGTAPEDVDFRPALPFTIDEAGSYDVVYYAKDQSGNREANKTAQVVLPGGGPEWESVVAGNDTVYLRGEALSVRPRAANWRFDVANSAIATTVDVDVFKGARAFPQLAGIPVSPTPKETASLRVTGDFVDYYRYRVNEGSWSEEKPAAEAINLEGLSGDVTVDVMARSRFGDYPSEKQISTSWTVSAVAPEFVVSGLPSQPSRKESLSMSVDGPNLQKYRWQLDDGFFHAELAAGESFTIENLEPGSHTLSLIGQRDGNWQSQDNASVVHWDYDPAYGSDFPEGDLVFHKEISDAQGQSLDFEWDGRDQDGTQQVPGWYTIRLTLTDALGQKTHRTRLTRIREISGDHRQLAGAERGPARAHARGDWAVWQERASGTWNIVAKNLGSGNTPITLTDGLVGQETPHTDGRYVVWERGRENGSTDIGWLDLEDPNRVIHEATRTSDRNEVQPVVDWPWIVYGTKPLDDPGAPLQLEALNTVSGEQFAVSPTSADQKAPAIHAGRIVWQDFRDVGFGEIYFSDLEAREVKRLTKNEFGQYFPTIWGNRVVWQDNRHGQLELYAYDFLKEREYRITDTEANEVHPQLAHGWLVYEEDSLGPLTSNLQVRHLESERTIPLTRSYASNRSPALSAHHLVWEKGSDDSKELMTASLPALQPVFYNRNAVAVTDRLANNYSSAFALLRAWRQEADVSAITRYTALVPEVERQVASWDSDLGQATGSDFAVNAGEFLWVAFNDSQVLDLGLVEGSQVDLTAGLNVLSYAEFPAGYTGKDLVEDLGPANVKAFRLFDASSGFWKVAEVSDGTVVGPNFRIPKVAVLFLEMTSAVSEWQPQ